MRRYCYLRYYVLENADYDAKNDDGEKSSSRASCCKFDENLIPNSWYDNDAGALLSTMYKIYYRRVPEHEYVFGCTGNNNAGKTIEWGVVYERVYVVIIKGVFRRYCCRYWLFR